MVIIKKQIYTMNMDEKLLYNLVLRQLKGTNEEYDDDEVDP